MHSVSLLSKLAVYQFGELKLKNKIVWSSVFRFLSQQIGQTSTEKFGIIYQYLSMNETKSYTYASGN